MALGCSASASFDVGGGIPWTYGITGSNHSLFIQDSTIFNLYESEISFLGTISELSIWMKQQEN